MPLLGGTYEYGAVCLRNFSPSAGGGSDNGVITWYKPTITISPFSILNLTYSTRIGLTSSKPTVSNDFVGIGLINYINDPRFYYNPPIGTASVYACVMIIYNGATSTWQLVTKVGGDVSPVKTSFSPNPGSSLGYYKARLYLAPSGGNTSITATVINPAGTTYTLSSTVTFSSSIYLSPALMVYRLSGSSTQIEMYTDYTVLDCAIITSR